MTPSIELSGNLGERHRSLNTLVNEAYLQKTPLQVHKNPDEPALDRLFKIDLASKQKNVDYVIYTLKDDDMLYVSRALKSLWLLDPEYSKIINPGFLENDLFPHMILTAVNKMRHWLQINLGDPQRCNEFYQFYKDRNFDIAAKFLWHCSNEYITSQIDGILDKITPKLLKRLSEKVPQVTKIYYDSLKQNEKLLKYYLEKDNEFFKNIKYFLKSDPDTFFFILENFFVNQKFKAFNADITKYIMIHHKNRFSCKPELYAVWFLDMKTLARYLSSEEIKDLVLKLARAEFIKSKFSYQNVEPLFKRLSPDERPAFKKLVFVDKDIGATIKEWPYPIPIPPDLKTIQTRLFDDIECKDTYYSCGPMDFRAMLKKRKYAKWGSTKTLLEELFDKYRFSNYKQTYNELRKRLRAEGSPQNRQYMILVLASKTGGRTDDLISLLDLLAQYKNEPVNIRAAVIRSLVKRAFVWRLPAEQWSRLLEWGHGLGLNGSTPEAECREGLHAVVIRDLLANVKPSRVVWEKFLTDFDSLKEYSLNTDERNCISARLPELLLTDALSDEEKPKLRQLKLFMNTLKAYNVRFDVFPGAVDAVASAVKYYWNADDGNLSAGTKKFLRRLYDAGVARKLFMREYFELNQSEASYLNALRHDISILGNLEKLVDERNLKHEAFFQKVAIYFMEKDGLGERYRAVLELWATTEPDETREPSSSFSKQKAGDRRAGSRCQTIVKPLAKALALLSGSNFKSLLNLFDAAPPKTVKQQLASALRGNAHLVRPTFDLKSFGWRKAGAKAIANSVTTCRQRDVEGYLTETLGWRRTLRIALVLAKRVNKERDVFNVLASERPGTALLVALKYFSREGDNSDLSVWEMVKSHISEANRRQLSSFVKLTAVPKAINAEYCFLVYLACKKSARDLEWQAFSKIPSVLAELDEKYIFDTNDCFLNDYFKDEPSDKEGEYCMVYIQIIAKFLLLSTSEEKLEERFSKVGLPLINRLKWFYEQSLRKNKSDHFFIHYFLFHLQYNKAYFNAKYVSCLSVFERIIEWLHGIFPTEKWFGKYVSVHITMLYYKTARYCIKRSPESFSVKSKRLEGAEMLGTIFGKFMSNEIEDLVEKYFPSITMLYASKLVEYLDRHFFDSYDFIEQCFTIGLFNGLLANDYPASCILAKYILKKYRYRLTSEHVNVILNKCKISKVEELRFAVDIEQNC